mmetsp:Transcript_99875/g.250374  ORF Transcript_99875/g.250374 Transcript_99875/m.250374 type:complete len:259 (-) Transcript_99875:344-1120(-)
MLLHHVVAADAPLLRGLACVSPAEPWRGPRRRGFAVVPRARDGRADLEGGLVHAVGAEPERLRERRPEGGRKGQAALGPSSRGLRRELVHAALRHRCRAVLLDEGASGRGHRAGVGAGVHGAHFLGQCVGDDSGHDAHGQGRAQGHPESGLGWHVHGVSHHDHSARHRTAPRGRWRNVRGRLLLRFRAGVHCLVHRRRVDTGTRTRLRHDRRAGLELVGKLLGGLCLSACAGRTPCLDIRYIRGDDAAADSLHLDLLA